MPNWSQIAERMARGMYGEQWQKEDAQKLDMDRVRQAMDLARSEEGRAASREGRAAEEFEYGKTRRGTKEKQEDAMARRAESEAIIQSNEAANWSEALARKIAKEERDAANDKERLKMEAQRLGISEQELALRRKEAAQREQMGNLELETAQATQAARIAGVNQQQSNLSRREYARQISAALNAALRNGDNERAAQLQEQLAGLQSEADRDAAVTGVQQEILDRRNRQRVR